MSYHIPIHNREKAACNILRTKFGYRIQELSTFFGRSTSQIHRILKTLKDYGVHFTDYRKSPQSTKQTMAPKRLATMQKYLAAWEAWILSPDGDPP